MAKFVFTDGEGKEREFEVGMDEFFKGLSSTTLAAWLANFKRSYDEYQDLGLTSARSQIKLADRIGENSENHSEELRKISVHTLKNMVENNDLLMKGYAERLNMHNTNATANIDVSSDAFVTLLASKIAEELND